MENSSNSLTMAEMILLENKSTNSLQVISLVSFLAVIIWIITFQDHLSYFLYFIQSRLHLFKFQLFSRPPIAENLVPEKKTEKGFHSPVLSRGEVESVMAEFGFPCDEETAGLFEDEEVKEEEVREAFEVFDEDGDGFIDERELKRVIWRLGFKGFSDEECLNMIRVFDGNDDGRIDLLEFANLLLVRGRRVLVVCDVNFI